MIRPSFISTASITERCIRAAPPGSRSCGSTPTANSTGLA